MSLKFIFFLFLLLVVAVFSVQNADIVRLRFLAWEFSASQALVIFLSAFIGVAVGAISSMLARRRRATSLSTRATPGTDSPPRSGNLPSSDSSSSPS